MNIILAATLAACVVGFTHAALTVPAPPAERCIVVDAMSISEDAVLELFEQGYTSTPADHRETLYAPSCGVEQGYQP